VARRRHFTDRLDQAEAEFSLLLTKELEAILRGHLGHYLGSRLRRTGIARSRPSPMPAS